MNSHEEVCLLVNTCDISSHTQNMLVQKIIFPYMAVCLDCVTFVELGQTEA